MAAILDFNVYFGPFVVLYALHQLKEGFSGFIMSENISKDSLFVYLCQLLAKICQYTDILSRMAAILDFWTSGEKFSLALYLNFLSMS